MTIEEKLEKEINEKIERIGFIELKENIKIKDDIYLKKGIDYPLKFSYLKKGLRDKSFYAGIDLEKFIDSMIYLIGIKKDIKNSQIYIKNIKDILKETFEYIISKAYESLKNDSASAIIYLQAYENLYGFDKRILFSKYQVIEYYTDKNRDEIDYKELEQAESNIINNYLDMIEEDEKFAPPYLRLAYIYENRGHFIKAKLYFEKYLFYSKEESTKEEVRQELVKIEDYVSIEAAQTYIIYGDNFKAIQALEKISLDYKDKMLLNLLKGKVNYALGKFEEASKFLELSCQEKITDENASLLAMAYAQEGQINRAKKILEEAIEIEKESNILYYDLATINLNENKLEEALENFKKSYRLHSDENIEKIIKKLEETIDKKNKS